jgi:hypothetical protein
MPGNVRHPESRDPESPERAPPHRDGQTTPQKNERRADQQPHERDESSASQQGAPSDLMQKAHDDVERGVTDTSRAEATDATYRRELRSEPQAAPQQPTGDADSVGGHAREQRATVAPPDRTPARPRKPAR